MIYAFKHVLGWEWAGCDEKRKEHKCWKTWWEDANRKT
jgi:hypothetical protein